MGNQVPRRLDNRTPKPKDAEFYETVIEILRDEGYGGEYWIGLRVRLGALFDEIGRLQDVEKEYKKLIDMMERAKRMAFKSSEETEVNSDARTS